MTLDEFLALRPGDLIWWVGEGTTPLEPPDQIISIRTDDAFKDIIYHRILEGSGKQMELSWSLENPRDLSDIKYCMWLTAEDAMTNRNSDPGEFARRLEEALADEKE